MPTAAILSACRPGGGLSGVARRMARGLAREHDVALFAFDDAGEAREEGGIHLFPLGGLPDALDQARALGGYLRAARPDLIVWYFDYVLFPHVLPVLLELQARGSRLAAYLPIDGRLVELGPLAPFARFDDVLFFDETARAAFEALLRERRLPGPRTVVLRHAIEADALRARADAEVSDAERDAARRRRFPTRPDLRGGFVVLNGNRYWERKRIDLSVAGFARFARSRPRTFLYLHLPGSTPELRARFRAQAQDLGVGDRVLLRDDGAALPHDELLDLYLACDVGLNTTMGEGWGLVSCEHALAGAAQVLPGHANLRALWGEGAEYTALVASERVWHSPHLEHDATCAESVASALARLHADRRHRRAVGQAGRRRMLAPELRPERVEARWAERFAPSYGVSHFPPPKERSAPAFRSFAGGK